VVESQKRKGLILLASKSGLKQTEVDKNGQKAGRKREKVSENSIKCREIDLPKP
jgi:hypothetical protein